MINHKFIKTDDTWEVKCLKSGGVFNTILWENGKVKKQMCPCCNNEIKK